VLGEVHWGARQVVQPASPVSIQTDIACLIANLPHHPACRARRQGAGYSGSVLIWILGLWNILWNIANLGLMAWLQWEHASASCHLLSTSHTPRFSNNSGTSK